MFKQIFIITIAFFIPSIGMEDKKTKVVKKIISEQACDQATDNAIIYECGSKNINGQECSQQFKTMELLMDHIRENHNIVLNRKKNNEELPS